MPAISRLAVSLLFAVAVFGPSGLRGQQPVADVVFGSCLKPRERPPLRP